MKRYKYGLNSTVVQSGRTGLLTPLCVQEVIPGDTLQGSLAIDFRTANVKKMCLNRAFYDVYTFYVPYRLVWSGFPTFLIKGTGTVPKVTDLFPSCFERDFTTDPVANVYTKLVPYLRRSLNMIYNKFFKEGEQVLLGEDDNGVPSVWYRSSDFYKSELPVARIQTTIDTSGSTLDVDDIRAAFAKDMFDKVRQFYGDTYVDYLNSLGVATGWTIQDEPELIARSQNDIHFKQTAATVDDANTDVGQIAGTFVGQMNHRIPRKFFPEHGVVFTVAVFRPEIMSTLGTHPISAHELQSDFWSPEREVVKVRDYKTALWLGSAVGLELQTELPNFEHLRRGLNYSTQKVVTDGYHAAVAPATIDDYRRVKAGNWVNAFENNLGEYPDGAVDADYVVRTITKLAKQSPLGTRVNQPLR